MKPDQHPENKVNGASFSMDNRGVDEARRQREARDRFDSSDDPLKQDEIRRVLGQGKPGLMESVARPIMICLFIIMGGWGFFTFGPALRSEGSQHVKSGISLSEQGRLSEAVAEFDEAIRLDPKLVQAYYHRGNVYRILGQYELAFQNYTDAIRLDTQFAPAYANRAVVFAFLGDQASARRDLEKAARLGIDPVLLEEAKGEVKIKR